MTIQQALFVKWLRIRQEGTWRWVAGKYYDRYFHKLPYSDIIFHNKSQFHGIELCDEAMKLLNEKIEDGWN